MTTISLLRFATLLLTAVLTAACARPEPPQLIAGDLVIDRDTTWSGELRIAGVVTVKKGATLTIIPGSRVRFARIDRDGDEIGDAELLVEGRLLAQGTAAEPILFTSAEPEPRPADWKYLYLDFAAPSRITHVISEYAYSGLQVHFSQAAVTDSVFRHNVDGVRFSTVNLELAGNRIHDNRHGLRYEERRSEAWIHHNDLRGNRVGIFVVTRSEDRALIEYNNIVGSTEYAVKLGLHQRGDVTLPRNWWGSPDPATAAGGFLDRRIDPQLGRVLTPEPLTAPVLLTQDKR